MTRFDDGVRSAPPILIVTTCWWASLARFAQLLQEAGCAVSVLCPPGHSVRAAPVSAVFDQSGLDPLPALARAIARSQPALVIPGDDRAVHNLHSLYLTGSQAERELIARSLGNPENHRVSTSRPLFLAAAAESSVPTPQGIRLDSAADLRDWVARVDPPWVLKRDGAWGGSGVRIVETKRAAKAAFHELRRGTRLPVALKRLIVNSDSFPLGDWLLRQRPVVSAQRHVRGQPGNLAIVCRDGALLAALVVEAVTCCGPTGPAAIVRVVDRPELVAGAARLARRLGLSGFIGLDFMVDEAGAAWVIEMNPRYTPLCNLRLADGRDVIGAFTRALTGRAAPPRQPAPAGMIAHFPTAWQWSRTDARLALCYQDIPRDHPALLKAMLQPSWPERQPLAKGIGALRRGVGLVRTARLGPAMGVSPLASESPDRAG
jgi:carbamoyl-phosphate synthase L subunit-like protein